MDKTKRKFLTLTGAAAITTLATPALASTINVSSLLAPARAKSKDRYISFFSQRTGESFEGLYRSGDQYIGASIKEINRVLRDFRTNDVASMDPALMDILFHLQDGVRYKGGNAPYEIISAFRSPKTNEMLRRAGEGVAKNSYHTKGQAIDLRVADISTKALSKIALDLKAGGVSHYKRSDFLHIDTGPVRTW